MQSKLLYVWRRVAELRNIHTAKRIVAQRWRQKVKLGRLLRPQLPLLAAWETLGGPHSDAVADLGRVLSAASTSLPLSDGARARTLSRNAYTSFTFPGVSGSTTGRLVS